MTFLEDYFFQQDESPAFNAVKKRKSFTRKEKGRKATRSTKEMPSFLS